MRVFRYVMLLANAGVLIAFMTVLWREWPTMTQSDIWLAALILVPGCFNLAYLWASLPGGRIRRLISTWLDAMKIASTAK